MSKFSNTGVEIINGINIDVRVQNLRKVEETHLDYKNSKIYAFRWEWEEKDDKGKVTTKREVVCHLFREGSKNQPLNLGEMSDGGKFGAVAQAVNEAKFLIDYWIDGKLNNKLRILKPFGYDLDLANLRFNEKIEKKEKFVLDLEKEYSENELYDLETFYMLRLPVSRIRIDNLNDVTNKDEVLDYVNKKFDNDNYNYIAAKKFDNCWEVKFTQKYERIYK